ncbi:protein kinase C-binding protein NELL1-like isoform X3 [Biomphalaria glabrata]|uniref:Protein kinase C-binding protein NELL1-like isoform X3 n=1 Tax=Biomphalaria glabrata TaxID=6526 RepID=A0A9W3AJN6_BIOGL|nr:protein kinase C-binding protein NELL1-like isoform X3 [Biomphalaria glabrata]
MCCEWSFTKSTHNRSTLCSARLLLALRVGLVFMLLLGSNIGLAVEPAGHEVLDLLQGLNATSAESLAGLRYTNGPNTSSPAILLEDPVRYIAMSRSFSQRAQRLLADHSDVTFLCSVQQKPGNTGTILALNSESNRLVEIESNGKLDELRFHYVHNGRVVQETFPYMLSDGLWHRLAISVSGDRISVYVDCNRIYQRTIQTPDRTMPLGSRPTSLFLGQRDGQYALFRGALQDVKIVTQAHGYLLQCPQQDTECSTCAKFQDLEQRVKEMTTMYTELTRKNGTVECHREECPSCPNPVYRDGECCPICQTTCYYSGKYYYHGQTVNPAVCVTCTCVNAVMQCNQLDVQKECPQLNCPESERISVHGECCPVCKGTDFCALGHDCHSNASCVNLATKYACHCQKGFDGDGHRCEDIDECKVAGGPKGHHCSDNTVCVNTQGSYRCDCLKGYSRQDSSECKDYDTCVNGINKCQGDFECVNVNGSYTCQCKEGYVSDGQSCQPHCRGDCRNGGKCIAPNVCECRHGYIGANCELDIDECNLGISNCQGHSVCVNIPGWYHCDCLEGFHSSWPDNNLGHLCLDVNECKGEGEGHTCHPSLTCVNTEGGYTCQCPNSSGCHKNCMHEGKVHLDKSRWTSVKDVCQECTCQEGRTICHDSPCDCASPSVNLRCCPSCDSSSTCPHQEFLVHQQSGDTWFYQCQRCKCMQGETSCWPINCPQQTCQNAIQRPGDCCPVCADTNPCAAWAMETGGQDLSQLSCSHAGVSYSHGDEWTLPSDLCTKCQCKAGHICCSAIQACGGSRPRF